MAKTTMLPPMLAFVLGGQQKCFEWMEWAKQFLPELIIEEMEKALQALAAKTGQQKVRQIYHKRLSKEVRNAPVRWTNALDVVNGQVKEVKVPENDQLQRLVFEILCLGRLALVADRMTLLAQKERKPEAEVWLSGHQCMVEVKWLDDPIVREGEGFWSRPLTDLRSEGVSLAGKDLPSHIHLRDKLEDTAEKFKTTPKSVNLLLVCWFSLPELGVTFVPALYGERFMKVPFQPTEFVLPEPDELGEDGLFARKGWELVSGVASLWTTIPIRGVLFPNPRALTPVPNEVAVKLTEAFGLVTAGMIWFPFTKEVAEALYDHYVRPLEGQFWGRLAAVNKEGQVLVGEDEIELTQKAIEQFGKGKFIVFRIGAKVVGRI